MNRPTLIIQTVCFDESDREAAKDLGARLYGLLTRPMAQPLAHGPGILVYRAVSPDQVDLAAADKLVLLPILGKDAHAFMRNEVVETLTKWHKTLGDGHVIPVPTSLNWRGEEGVLPGKNLLTQLYGPYDRQQRTVDEIIIAILRLFDASGAKSRLFISHAKADQQASANAAAAIRNYVATDLTAQTFFDVNDLAAGNSLPQQIDSALQNGVFVAIRTDAYSSRDWCVHELLESKRNRIPLITVELLTDGEALSSPYGGNAPTLVWNTHEDQQQGTNPQRVVSRALVECLRAAHFHVEKDRIIASAGLPGDTVDLCRPPELLDLVQGPIHREHTQVVIHPDPELPTAQRNLLALAQPRMKLVTPTTAFRRIVGRGSAIENPFDGKQIAFSISDSPDVNGPQGFTKEHIDDVAVYIARCLISTGAHLAYGGDFRLGGYTGIFSELISAYRQTAGKSDDILHSYLAAFVALSDAPDNLPISAHHLDREPLKSEALLPSPKLDASNGIPKALYYSDMRRVMTRHMLARVILGGASKPGIPEINQKGYGGLYPGVVEEAWRTLEAGQPLYVIGGFGGAAGIVAALMNGRETPKDLEDSTWMKHDSYKSLAKEITASPFFQKLNLPANMNALDTSIRALAAKFLASDDTAIEWNGLSLDENRELMWTRDPLRIVTLVFQGLRKYWLRRLRQEGKLEIELVEGTVAAAQELDAIAVAVFEGMPLGGAGAALDRLASGRATLAHASGQTLVSMDSAEIAANFVYLASLGLFSDLDGLSSRILMAARGTAECALRHGFSRLGIVSFGGGMAGDLKDVAKAMIDGIHPLAGQASILWYENDPGRFADLQQALETDSRIRLTTRRQTAAPAIVVTNQAEQMVLSVTLAGDVLSSTVMPPSGTGVARTIRTPFTRKEMLAFSHGSAGRSTPGLEDLTDRGRKLSVLLFGEDAADLISHCRNAKVMLIHDVIASQLPFEILGAPAAGGTEEIRPVLEGGVSRRLAVSGLSTQQLFAKPPHTGRLKVLVVIDPLGDLPNAAKEGEKVVSILSKLPDIELKVLPGKDATKAAFLSAIAGADILHYCGHAFYDGPGPEESGLNLPGDPLFFTDLMLAPTSLRFAFVNACESLRVRAPKDPDAAGWEAATFAEYLLRTGIEAFLGTYWRVGDAAAADFSTNVYTCLAQGDTLATAVKKSRLSLIGINSHEWANYVLYGEGQFRIVLG